MKSLITVVFFGRTDRYTSGGSSTEVVEYDFILNELLPKDKDRFIRFIPHTDVQDISNVDVFIYRCRSRSFCWDSNPDNYPWGFIPTFDEVLEAVNKVKPKIIIQLSDEYVEENNDEHNQIADKCELFLRQYSHYTHNYLDNTYQIPLRDGAVTDTNKIKPVLERNYNWIFVGAMKSDREKMIESFRSIPKEFVATEGISKDAVIDMYTDSIFIPSGRGHSSLDCFRLYEGTMCGAIPVVVGSPGEINSSFRYTELPPWVFAESWNDAVLQCKELLNDSEALQKKQEDVLNWWNNTLSNIKNKVNKVLTKEKTISEKLQNFPPVHFISTEDSEERRKLLYEKFAEYNITNVTPHIFKRYEDGDYVFYGQYIDKMIGPGRGPLTSHLRTIKEWYLNTDEPYAFFCEDDLSFETVQYWNFTWEEFFESLPKNWECVQLCWVREEFYTFLIEFRNRCWCDWSGCAYLISREYARKVIENYHYDDEFHLDLKGDDIEMRPEWFKIPVIETIIFSSIGKVYGMPLFVEDVNNCLTTWRWGSGNEVNYWSYKISIEWWENTGQYLTLNDHFKNIRNQ
jgi:hypothetical protein